MTAVSGMVCVVPLLQPLRRDLAFAVSDRIRLGITASACVETATTEYNSWIANELLARELLPGELRVGQQVHEPDLDGSLVRAALFKEL